MDELEGRWDLYEFDQSLKALRMAIAALRREGELIEALTYVDQRLSYLRCLWGDEGITKELCDKVTAALQPPGA